MTDTSHLLTAEELAPLVRIRAATLNKFAKFSLIPAVIIQKQFRFDLDAVVAALRDMAGYKHEAPYEPRRLVTPEELGLFTGSGKVGICRLMMAGRIPYFCHGRTYLLDPDVAGAMVEGGYPHGPGASTRDVQEWWRTRPALNWECPVEATREFIQGKRRAELQAKMEEEAKQWKRHEPEPEPEGGQPT